jgi:ribonuclease VapC
VIALDTSALIAILSDEPERRQFNQVIAAAPIRLIGAVNLFEPRIVLYRRIGSEGLSALDEFPAMSVLQ